MPLYTPEDEAFARITEPFFWFENVLAVEYGEWETDESVPSELNWVHLLPVEVQLSLEDIDCSLAYVGENGYTCTVWDVSGEDDLPWAVFLVDSFGSRLLNEYSLLAEEGEEETLSTLLARAADEIPERLLRGDFDRSGEPIAIPAFLRDDLFASDSDNE